MTKIFNCNHFVYAGYEAFAPHGETEAAVSGTSQATDSASKTINRHVHQMPPPPGQSVAFIIAQPQTLITKIILFLNAYRF